MDSRHSQRVWQPMLTMGLKEHFVLENTRKLAERWVMLDTRHLYRRVWFGTQYKSYHVVMREFWYG